MWRLTLRMSCCILFVVLVLAGCGSPSQNISLAACGSFAVPGMYTFDLKGGTYSCEVLETDQYGRILYEYTTFSETTGEKEQTAYVICQKFDKSNVYFYDEICYSIENDKDYGFSELKQLNDWNCELDESKMTRKEYIVSFDLYLHQGE